MDLEGDTGGKKGEAVETNIKQDAASVPSNLDNEAEEDNAISKDLQLPIPDAEDMEARREDGQLFVACPPVLLTTPITHIGGYPNPMLRQAAVPQAVIQRMMQVPPPLPRPAQVVPQHTVMQMSVPAAANLMPGQVVNMSPFPVPVTLRQPTAPQPVLTTKPMQGLERWFQVRQGPAVAQPPVVSSAAQVRVLQPVSRIVRSTSALPRQVAAQAMAAGNAVPPQAEESDAPLLLPASGPPAQLLPRTPRRALRQQGTINIWEKPTDAFTLRLYDGFSKELINGKFGPKGIIRPHDDCGVWTRVHPHQKAAVIFFNKKERKTTIVLHTMGLGKTYTAMFAIAARYCKLGGRWPKILWSCPAAVIDQTVEHLHHTLKIRTGRLLVVRDGSHEACADMRNADIIVVSSNIIMRAFVSCFERRVVQVEVIGGETKSKIRWVPKEGATPHPLVHPPINPTTGWFANESGKRTYDTFIIDEVHNCRNFGAKITHAHSHIARELSKKVMGLTGTLVVNDQYDPCGIAFATGMADYWCEKKNWRINSNEHSLNQATSDRYMEEFAHEADNKDLLPISVETAVNFAVSLPPDARRTYKTILQEARSLRINMQRHELLHGRAARADVQKLVSMLQMLQQYIVSPLCAEYGAEAIKNDKVLFEKATREPMGSWYALVAELRRLRAGGHRRIVVACHHVTEMKIVKTWIEREHVDLGETFMFTGDITSMNKRLANKDAFLRAEHALLFLGIKTGGTGLHLVPGCEAMVFFGAMPWSPANTDQCVARINRMGQNAPITGQVTAVHLVAYGSIDAAIAKLHGDKRALIKAVRTGERLKKRKMYLDEDSEDEDTNVAEWRDGSRICDNALLPDQHGNFPPMPLYMPTREEASFANRLANKNALSDDEDGDEDPELDGTTPEEADADDYWPGQTRNDRRIPYTTLPSVVTRGREGVGVTTAERERTVREREKLEEDSFMETLAPPPAAAPVDFKFTSSLLDPPVAGTSSDTK